MDLICTFFSLTFYPAAYPSEAEPMVLLAPGALIDAASPIVADLEQIVQTANYLRGEVPAYFVRGGRSLRLSWEEMRKCASPGAALAASLERQEAMPSRTGWVLLTIPSQGRSWAISPVAFTSHRTVYQLGDKIYRLSWNLEAGSLTEIATSAAEAALTTEIGVEMATEDDAFYLALEDAV